MIVLLWAQYSAKDMVLKWPYAFQISRFSKGIIATCMGFQNMLSCLSMFAKRTWAVKNKFLLMCSDVFQAENSFYSAPFSHSHTDIHPIHCSLSCHDIYFIFLMKTFIHTLRCLLNYKCLMHLLSNCMLFAGNIKPWSTYNAASKTVS